METQEKMGFGKYKGIPLCEVPVDYLAWVLDTFRSPPVSVLAELQRRGEKAAGGAAFVAYAAISKHKFKASRRKPRKARRSPRGVRKAVVTRRDVQRQEAHEQARSRRCGVVVVGERYADERARWEAAGGDPDACPFAGDCDMADAHLRSIVSGG